MKIGFTGTRDGTTIEQRRALADWLAARQVAEFHHGCCVGADADAVTLAWGVKQIYTEIHAHLSTLPGRFTDNDALRISGVVHAAKHPLDRNRDIVDASDVLLACPKGPEEQRSGTWSTVRYARRRGKRVVLFWPNGEVTEE